jgi:hypothetical protein
LEATKEAMAAKRDFEIAEQESKVDALAQQVFDRASRLADLASDVRYAAQHALDQPVLLPAGAFGSDTETIDALLAVLSQESASLANMRAARAKNEEMVERYEGRLGEIQAAVDGAFAGQPEARVFEMPGAQPEPVTAGIYM